MIRLWYKGKAKDMTLKELWMLWRFGRQTEQLETEDLGKN